MKFFKKLKNKFIEKALNGKKFTLDECASFKYWFAHYCAVNAIALKCDAWRTKYLIHDLEKPFLKLLWKDPDRVQEFHVKHANHHPQNKPFEKVDIVEMVLDWESARYTKEFAPLSAREFYEKQYKGKTKFTLGQQKEIETALNYLGL